MMANSKRKFTIKDLILDTSIELPVIVELLADNKKHSLKKGDLLWLTQLVEEDGHNAETTVEASRWDAPDFTLTFKMADKITFAQRTYSSVKEDISFGPVMDVSGLANLSRSAPHSEHAELVFGISVLVEESQLFLKMVEGAGRIVCHGKQHMTGFLAKGTNNPLMIPGDYKGMFTKSQTSQDKPSRLTDLFSQLPMEVKLSDNKEQQGLQSPDEITLLRESPITILAFCRFTATHFSLHDEDAIHALFRASWLYPDYCKLLVRPASPIPLYSQEDYPTPIQRVQILTSEQFQEMNDRLKQSPPLIPTHSPQAKSPTAKSVPVIESIYEVSPPDARGAGDAVISGDKAINVSPRRSVKRNKHDKQHGRRAVSDLGLNEMSHKEYVNIGMMGPAKGMRSDDYMAMYPGLPPGAPAVKPRPQLATPTMDEKRKPTPKPRASNNNTTASSLPSRPVIQRRTTDSDIQLYDNELNHGQDYTLITEESKNINEQDADYGGYYADVYNHTRSHTWSEGDLDDGGYLKPRKDL